MMLQYCVVESDNLAGLKEQVEEKIKAGWVVQGGICNTSQKNRGSSLKGPLSQSAGSLGADGGLSSAEQQDGSGSGSYGQEPGSGQKNGGVTTRESGSQNKTKSKTTSTEKDTINLRRSPGSGGRQDGGPSGRGGFDDFKGSSASQDAYGEKISAAGIKKGQEGGSGQNGFDNRNDSSRYGEADVRIHGAYGYDHDGEIDTELITTRKGKRKKGKGGKNGGKKGAQKNQSLFFSGQSETANNGADQSQRELEASLKAKGLFDEYIKDGYDDIQITRERQTVQEVESESSENQKEQNGQDSDSQNGPADGGGETGFSSLQSDENSPSPSGSGAADPDGDGSSSFGNGKFLQALVKQHNWGRKFLLVR